MDRYLGKKATLRAALTGLETFEFDWKGETYRASGRWEVKWVKWALENNPKALDTYMEKGLKYKRTIDKRRGLI
jgi:hypothetical protein